MATPLKPIECSAQPLSISFHPVRDIVAAGLVDGTVEIHDLIAKCSSSSGDDAKAKVKATSSKSDDDDDGNDDDDMGSDNDNDNDEADTILSSIYVAKKASPSKSDTRMLAKVDDDNTASGNGGGRAAAATTSRATQGPSCRCVLFSRPLHENGPGDANANNADVDVDGNGDAGGGGAHHRHHRSGGEYLYTACNGGSLRCLDSELACSLDNFQNPDGPSPILWSIENAHNNNAGIHKLYQLPYSSPCGPALVTGDDVGTVRLWDTRMCGGGGNNNNNDNQQKGGNNNNNNPFDNLMKLPRGCVQHWKVNYDYITDFDSYDDGTSLFATSADGTLSVFDVRFANRKGTPRSVCLPDIDPTNHSMQQQWPQHTGNGKKSTWDAMGYTRSDNQEDELLSVTLMKKSQKLLVGTQQGILSLFSRGEWSDISDRFPGHPQSIDALLKIDEDTVLTGSSDGLVRAVQLLPNALLGVLGAHDGFPVEGMGWSAGRKLVGSVSHDENIRLWDASFLNEDDDDDDDEDDEDDEDGEGGMQQDDGAPRSKSGATGAPARAKMDDDSEDDWEDMDEDKDMEDDDDMDSDSDDSGDGGGGGKPKKRENIFKTENEAFFSDL